MKEPWEYWEEHCAKQEEYRDLCPVCERCGEPIEEDTYYDLGGEYYHFDCLLEEFGADTEQYVERERERRNERN